MKPRRVTILQKGLMVLALPLLYQALFIGLLLKRQHDLNEAQMQAVHTKDVIIQIDLVYRALLTSQSDLRAFVITGNEIFAEEMEGLKNVIQQQSAELKRLVKDNGKQQERLESILPLVQQRMDFEWDLVQRKREGDLSAINDEIQKLRGKEMMDRLGGKIEDFRRTEEKLDEKRIADLSRSSTVQNGLLIGGLIFNLAIGALAAVMFSREIGRRIKVFTENTRRLARGEALQPIGAGSDEIAELDQEFHLMAENLAAGQKRERLYQEALESRAAELLRANRDLDQKNQEIEMFVYSVSHDLRSPLVNLQGFSQELAQASDELRRVIAGGLEAPARARASELVERDVTESVHYIQTAVTRLSSIIDALLRLSRAGRIEYHPRLVELAPVVTRIISAMAASIKKHGAAVTIHTLPPVWADPTAIEQIFANLIGNAVNYLDPTRACELEIGVVERTVEGLESPQVYYVRDNGLGIAAAYLPKVFAIFQRLHGATAAGEGVGLALVRRMVERHGGRVWVESVEGAGSTFFVALPSAETSPLAVVAPRKESISITPRPA